MLISITTSSPIAYEITLGRLEGGGGRGKGGGGLESLPILLNISKFCSNKGLFIFHMTGERMP